MSVEHKGSTISRHIRSNVIGYMALFVAMSGVAYATDGPLPGQDQVGSADVINNDLTTADINNADGVRSADVRDDTLANGGLQAVDLRPDSVGSSEVAPDSLDAVDLNAGSVGASEVSDQSLGSDDLAAGSVGSSEVSDESLGSADLGAGSVGGSEVAADAIGSGQVAPDSLTAVDLAPDSVESSELAANSVTGSEVAFGSLSGTDIRQDSLSGNDIFDGSIASSEIGTGAVGASEVADESLGTAEFASSIPAVHVTRNTGDQLIANNTQTTLGFTAERYDTANMHSNTSNTGRLTAPVDGIYAVNASFVWGIQGAFPSGERSVILRKNGTIEVAADQRDADTAPAGGVTVNLTIMLRLAAGDFIEARVFQDSGGTRDIRDLGGESSPEFSMTWLAPGP